MKALSVVLVLAAGTAQAEVALQVSFSDAARAKLTELGERVVVNAMYYGDPTEAGQPYADDGMGLVSLGDEVFTLWPRDQVVTLGGAMAGLPLDLVVEPGLNVNIYSARFAHEDNLLDCGLVDAPLREVEAAPQAMYCKLIGE